MAEAFFSLLGLGRRAGMLAGGHHAVEHLLDRGKCGLLILAVDAAPGTRRRFRGRALPAGVPVLVAGSKEELGRATGMAPRAVIAVEAGPLAGRILKAGAEIGGVVYEPKRKSL